MDYRYLNRVKSKIDEFKKHLNYSMSSKLYGVI